MAETYPHSDELPAVPTHTEEARALVAAGTVKPGDKTLDLPVSSMSDREILEETLIHARNTRDAVSAFLESMMSSPMGKLLASGATNPFAGMSG